MIVFYVKRDEESADIRIICGKQSKIISAVRGSDVSSINDIIETIKKDDSIKNVNICLNHYEDETEINKFLTENCTIHDSKNKDSVEECFCKDKKCKNNSEEKQSFRCPECGSDQGLVDKNGKVYPCYSCIQIDVGKKILNQYGEIFNEKLGKNTEIIQMFCNLVEEQKKLQAEKETKKKGKKNDSSN